MLDSAARPPAPRTRPRNRRDLILRAAADLFAERGYHNVSTGQVADAVGIGPSALYRHVHGKLDLLGATLGAEFDAVELLLADAAPADAIATVEVLAGPFARRRQLGVLWSRESRHLSDAGRHQIRARIRAVLDMLAGQLGTGHDDTGPRTAARVTALAVLSVLTSPAHHHTALSVDRLTALLVDLAGAVIDVPRPDVTSGLTTISVAPEGVPAVSRSALIIAAASELFHRRGYQSVTMADIGAAVGATGASLYRYFPTKGDLLTAVTTRGTEALHVGLAGAMAAADSPRDALRRTAAAYIEFAVAHRDLLGVLVTEMMNIDPAARRQVRQLQRSYVQEWCGMLEAARPEVSTTEVRFRVHAALTIVNDAVRTGPSRQRPELAASLGPLVAAVLD